MLSDRITKHMPLNIISNILTQANTSLALAVGQKFDFYY